MDWHRRSVSRVFSGGVHRVSANTRPGGDDTPLTSNWRFVCAARNRFLPEKNSRTKTNLRCHLLVDQSRSMTLRPRLTYSQIRLRPHAGRHACVVLQWGRAMRLDCSPFAGRVQDYLPARHRARTPAPAHACVGPRTGKVRETNLWRTVAPRVAELARKRGLIVLIFRSGFAPVAELERNLGRPHRPPDMKVVIFQILDPERNWRLISPPRRFFQGHLKATRPFTLDPQAVRVEYPAPAAGASSHSRRGNPSAASWGFAFHQVVTKPIAGHRAV